MRDGQVGSPGDDGRKPVIWVLVDEDDVEAAIRLALEAVEEATELVDAINACKDEIEGEVRRLQRRERLSSGSCSPG